MMPNLDSVSKLRIFAIGCRDEDDSRFVDKVSFSNDTLTIFKNVMQRNISRLFQIGIDILPYCAVRVQ